MKFFTDIEGRTGAYQAIGRKMFTTYPAIKRDGLHPWVKIEMENILKGTVGTWKNKLQHIISSFMNKIPATENVEAITNGIQVLQYIENEISFKKGKGVKLKPVFVFVENSDEELFINRWPVIQTILLPTY